ncbi:hypothetical protein [Bradyrhizobium sp.]|uniref:hypothetical protein n=1 Tax=Bradyrhizobium sp. TaxID=376 RepID=UPI001D68B56A|nr:hypothetical protein [Bradyrhizobium sp.]MBI5321781.1 hypothetical protein [Bradyrhizobium sp.]
MPADDEWKRATKGEWLVAVALIAAGMTISALAIGEIRVSQHQQLAQATQSPPSSPPEVEKKDEPTESKSGGTRPTTPAPEPARPDPDAQKAGAQPALPPAPAEKIAPPIRER